MCESKPIFRLASLGQSVRGASHLRTDLPNQDAWKGWPAMANGVPAVVLAVADGHGSVKCFRSDEGARLAVDGATQIIPKFLEGMRGQPLSVIKNSAEKLLTSDLVKHWREAVSNHFKVNPFTTIELARLDKEAGAAGLHAVCGDGRHWNAYGATLLAVAVTQSFILYLQLGDGDILTVSDKTGQVESPLARDETLIANETTSLCMENAHRLFRFRFQHLQETAPALILLSTDGYSNSFSSEADFQKVGSDLLHILKADGIKSVEGALASWLEDASKIGSGDDVTLGMICRLDAIGVTVPLETAVQEAGVPAIAASRASPEPLTIADPKACRTAAEPNHDGQPLAPLASCHSGNSSVGKTKAAAAEVLTERQPAESRRLRWLSWITPWRRDGATGKEP